MAMLRYIVMVEPLASAKPDVTAGWLGPTVIYAELSENGGNMTTSNTSESPAVELARSHLEAWTNHDLDTARGNLADDVQFDSPAAKLVGIDEYMNGARGLAQFAKQVVPGSLRIIAATGDDRNALIMYEVRTEGGQFGPKLFPSAQTWLLDENGKIKVERIVSIVIPLKLV
jgi:hypothetical protein